MSSIISVHIWFEVSSNKQKPNKHYIVPVFSYITVEFSHHQRGDNHTTKHTTEYPYSTSRPVKIKKKTFIFTDYRNKTLLM